MGKKMKKEMNEGRKIQNKMRRVRFEVFKALSMKNVVFWDINTQFVPHRKDITSPLQRSAG
jgi:hypothetical protein